MPTYHQNTEQDLKSPDMIPLEKKKIKEKRTSTITEKRSRNTSKHDFHKER